MHALHTKLMNTLCELYADFFVKQIKLLKKIYTTTMLLVYYLAFMKI